MPRFSFKETVIEHFGADWRDKLQKQYEEIGVRGLEKYWGYSTKTISNCLSKMGIKVYKKGWDRWHKQLEDRIDILGGIRSLINEYKKPEEIAQALGVSRTAIYNLLLRKGWKWDKEKREWYRPHESDTIQHLTSRKEIHD